VKVYTSTWAAEPIVPVTVFPAVRVVAEAGEGKFAKMKMAKNKQSFRAFIGN
jgi:hypothetical protein